MIKQTAASVFYHLLLRHLSSHAFWHVRAGWTKECLQEWGSFIQLAIPSMLMLCLEWWLFEVGGFLAGVISEAELGSQSIIYELTVVAYMVKNPSSAIVCFRFFFFLNKRH